MVSPLATLAGLLALSAGTVFAQSNGNNQIGGPSCSEHPADALQCSYQNGTSVGSICATSTGVLCCSVPSDCQNADGTPAYTATSRVPPPAANTGFPPITGTPGGRGTCRPGNSTYFNSAVCDPIDGTTDYYPCDTPMGRYCCEYQSDCVAGSGSSNVGGGHSTMGSKPTPSTPGGGNSNGAAKQTATTSSKLPMFTNEAVVARGGVGAAALVGVFGVAAAFL